jgi:antitoxin VapB
MDTGRHVKLFRNGRNQAVRIPVEFELPGDEAIMRKDGDRLIIEPAKTSGLLQWLATIEPWDEEFPDVDGDQLPLEDIEL